MDHGAPIAQGGDFSIGRVFQNAFGTIGTNPVVTIGLGLLFGAVPAVAMSVMNVGENDLDQLPSAMMGAFTVLLATMLLSLIIAAFTQGVMTRATVAHSEGRKAGFGESLGAALPVFLPLIGLALLIGIGVMIGMVLLIVPGIILYVIWSVAAPALVEERRGVFASLSRSRDLTRGHRWKIFGTLFVMLVIYYLILAAFALVDPGLANQANGQAQLSTTTFILTALSGTATSLIWSLVQAATYVELRRAADGMGETQLEQVFA